MNVGIIDCGSKKVPDIAGCFESAGCNTTTIKLSEVDENNLLNCNAVVLSGGPVMISEVDQSQFIRQGQKILNYKIPTLGICLGHQIIGLCYGAVARMGTEDRDWREIEILEVSPLFTGLGTKFHMRQDHCEEIELPEGFTHLAKSDTCPVEAMVHKTLPVVGVQFHPESSEKNGQLFIENFLKHFNLL